MPEANNPHVFQRLFERLKSMNFIPLNILKIILVLVVALALLSFALQLLGSTLGNLRGPIGTFGFSGNGQAAQYSYESRDAIAPSASITYGVAGGGSASLSPLPPGYPYPSPTSGSDAEAYEVTQYNASIETRRLQDTCGKIENLKARADVIFENSSRGERNCGYTFKVAHASADEVLALIKTLDPKDFSDNTYTIKNQVENYSNEAEVLKSKRDSIDETLKSAISAYDEVTELATRSQNADALAKIIDSKISVIQRLTQERISIDEQLDRLAREKAKQLDMLDYSYFYVSVYESRFVDFENIKDSWKQAIQNFVRDLNVVLQDVTINLVLLLFLIAQWALYALLALLAVKYCWKVARYIWFK